MKSLVDPDTGEELVLYTAKGESDECWIADVTRVVNILSRHYNKTESETRLMLARSSMDNPVEYMDEVFWVE